MSINNRLINTGGAGVEPVLDGQRQIYFYNSDTYISEDFGATFNPIPALNGVGYYGGYISAYGEHIILFKNTEAIISHNAGATWTSITTSNSNNPDRNYAFASLSDDGNYAYIFDTTNGQFRSDDGGATFTLSTTPRRFSNVGLRCDPTGQFVYYFNTGSKELLKSSNFGISYVAIYIDNNIYAADFNRYVNFAVGSLSGQTAGYTFYGNPLDGTKSYFSGSVSRAPQATNGGNASANINYFMTISGVSGSGFYQSPLNTGTPTNYNVSPNVSAYGTPNSVAMNGSGSRRTITTATGTYISDDYGVTYTSIGDGISAGKVLMNQGDF